MGIWDSLFGKAEREVNNFYEAIPDNFRELTIRGIELIGRDSREMDTEELFDHLVSNGIPALEAKELITFLPTAFCRKMLPDINWHAEYIDCHSEGMEIRRKYQDNPRYRIIEEETENYSNTNPNGDFVLHIAGRSAEFRAINQLLLEGGKLEGLRLTESYVFR